MKRHAGIVLILALAMPAGAQTTVPRVPVEASGTAVDIAAPEPCQDLLHSIGGSVAACEAIAQAGGREGARAHSALAAHAQRQGDLALARRHVELALAGEYAGGAILNNFANLLLAEQNYVDALANYETALEDVSLSRTDIAAIHLNQALCLRALGRYDAAKDAYLAHETWLAEPLQGTPPAR